MISMHDGYYSPYFTDEEIERHQGKSMALDQTELISSHNSVSQLCDTEKVSKLL